MLAQSNKYDATGGQEQRDAAMKLIKSANEGITEDQQKWFALFSVSGYRNSQSPSSILDMLVHLALWIVVLVFEIMIFVKTDDWRTTAANAVPFPYALASLVLLSVSMGTMVLLTILTSWNWVKLDRGHPVDAYLVNLIAGPLKLSMLFTLIVVIFATDIATSTEEWRGRTIVLITFKSLLMTQLDINLQKIANLIK